MPPAARPSPFRMWRHFAVLLLVSLLLSCGGGAGHSSGSAPPPAATRSFYMGSTPFHAGVNATSILFPDWKFENMGERDLLSLHVDDFWGVPWDYCTADGCSNLPAAWTNNWQRLAANAKASGKTIYLALSPLTDRRTLAGRVLPNGTIQSHWSTAVDAKGCYRFDSDSAAADFKARYIGYLKYLVNLVGPRYLSPSVEMNIPFAYCPEQKAAWQAWYGDVHTAIKAAYPTLVVFPTFQLEFMYGVAAPETRCANASYAQCFDLRLHEALGVAADRMALSTYPVGWSFESEFGFGVPTDTFAKIRQATSRKIWISETGWTVAPLRGQFAHGARGSCGPVALPATLNVPGWSTPIDVANETAQTRYLGQLLEQAHTHGLEAVVWWLNRDYLDAAVAQTCPCAPSDSATCTMTQAFYDVGGETAEYLLRAFANMGLRRIDGGARPAQAVWSQWMTKTHQP